MKCLFTSVFWLILQRIFQSFFAVFCPFSASVLLFFLSEIQFFVGLYLSRSLKRLKHPRYVPHAMGKHTIMDFQSIPRTVRLLGFQPAV